MMRAKIFLQTLPGLLFLVVMIAALVGLFASASHPQTSTTDISPTPALEATLTLPAEPTPQPTLISPLPSPSIVPTPEPHTAGILYESAGELYWLPVDDAGNPFTSPMLVFTDASPETKVGQMFAAPDGSQIVYELYSLPPEGCCEGISKLYALSPPNGQPREIHVPATIAKIFGWHPDSQHLIYGESDVGLFNVNSGESTVIANTQQWANLPYSPQIDGVAFSPDGEQVIVSFTLSGQNWEVWTLNADGSTPQMLFKTDYPIFAFAWSPDGSLIAFIGQGLEVMTPGGHDRRVLSKDFSVGWGFEPVWSPDSQLIAFIAAEAFPDDLFTGHKLRLADPVTGKEHNVISDSTSGEVEPVWSPDGKWVLFLSNRSGASEIWRAWPDGTQMELREV